MSTKFTIELGPARGRVIEALPIEIRERVREQTSYAVPVAGGKMGLAKLFHEPTGYFPAGLAQRVKKTIIRCGGQVEVLDYRERIKVDASEAMARIKGLLFRLRDYQIDGIIQGLKHRHGLFSWPTGSGKTVLFSALLACYDLPALVLTHRKELLFQMQRVISKMTGQEVGIIGAGKWEPKRWTVGLVDSIVHRTKATRTVAYLKKVKYLLGDEIHHMGATTWWQIPLNCVNTVVRHGFSGTCFRTDNAGLQLLAQIGDVISEYKTSYMIENGWLSKPNITVKTIGSDKKANRNANWRVAEKVYIVDNDVRNNFACQYVEDRVRSGEQILIMVNRLRHGATIQRMLNDKYGVKRKLIRYMTGRKNDFVRKEALKDFAEGYFQVLIGTSIYNEGVDLPNIGAAVNLAAGDSEIATVQRLGRALRKTKEEGRVDVDPMVEQTVDYLDFDDQDNEITRRWSKHRLSFYNGEPAFNVSLQ